MAWKAAGGPFTSVRILPPQALTCIGVNEQNAVRGERSICWTWSELAPKGPIVALGFGRARPILGEPWETPRRVSDYGVKLRGDRAARRTAARSQRSAARGARYE